MSKGSCEQKKGLGSFTVSHVLLPPRSPGPKRRNRSLNVVSGAIDYPRFQVFYLGLPKILFPPFQQNPWGFAKSSGPGLEACTEEGEWTWSASICLADYVCLKQLAINGDCIFPLLRHKELESSLRTLSCIYHMHSMLGWFSFQNPSRIFPLLTTSTVPTLVLANIISHLDDCWNLWFPPCLYLCLLQQTFNKEVIKAFCCKLSSSFT